MKVKIKIMGPAKKLVKNNPETLDLPEGSKIIDMMEKLGYTKTEAKFLVYVRGEEKLSIYSKLKEDDYIKAVLQAGGG